MIWLTWRQFRAPALVVFGVLGVVAAALAATGPDLNREYADLSARCTPGCIGDVYDNFFFPRLGVYLGLILLVSAVPVVIGVFWGAPLVSREFETGTQDLVWQQSVPRRRWLAVKLSVVGLAAVLQPQEGAAGRLARRGLARIRVADGDLAEREFMGLGRDGGEGDQGSGREAGEEVHGHVEGPLQGSVHRSYRSSAL